MKTVSKSKYLMFNNCPKSLWMLLNKPELGKEDPTAQKHIDDGKVVGSLAKSYFEDTVDVYTEDEKGNPDIKEMIELTNRYLLKGENTIAEASFSIEGLYCAIDLLHPSKDGNYDIYEVKATTNVEKEHYIDAAFQKYVLEKRGLTVDKVYILHLNNEYIRHGDINVKALFIADDITYDPRFLIAYNNIDEELVELRKLASDKNEPIGHLSTNCKECPFKEYCHSDVPKPSVLDINGLRGRYDLYNDGVISYTDVLVNHVKLNKRQQVQVDAYMHNRELTVDREEVDRWLATVSYPIYHLDFESIQLPIPPCDGAWPYEQIPTQYSLHIEYEDGILEHKEFLGDSIDPRRAIAEALCRDIPMNACVLAYNKQFECGRIQELADLYPDLREHLINMKEHVVDLLVPFKSGNYYHINMGGSNSIKYVLPALCPNDPALDYHALPVVHNGGEAMDIYPKMLEASPEERERIRDGLLKYCCLDTLAMVKVLEKIK